MLPKTSDLPFEGHGAICDVPETSSQRKCRSRLVEGASYLWGVGTVNEGPRLSCPPRCLCQGNKHVERKVMPVPYTCMHGTRVRARMSDLRVAGDEMRISARGSRRRGLGDGREVEEASVTGGDLDDGAHGRGSWRRRGPRSRRWRSRERVPEETRTSVSTMELTEEGPGGDADLGLDGGVGPDGNLEVEDGGDGGEGGEDDSGDPARGRRRGIRSPRPGTQPDEARGEGNAGGPGEDGARRGRSRRDRRLRRETLASVSTPKSLGRRGRSSAPPAKRFSARRRLQRRRKTGVLTLVGRSRARGLTGGEDLAREVSMAPAKRAFGRDGARDGLGSRP